MLRRGIVLALFAAVVACAPMYEWSPEQIEEFDDFFDASKPPKASADMDLRTAFLTYAVGFGQWCVMDGPAPPPLEEIVRRLAEKYPEQAKAAGLPGDIL